MRKVMSVPIKKKAVSPKAVGFGLLMLSLPCAGLLHTARIHHASLVLSHYLHGRAGSCSLAESFEGESLSRRQFENASSIRSASHVVRTDERFSLWSTPTGEYWLPIGSKEGIFYDLAEQQRNIYGNHIRAGDIVLDAGANIGVFTRKALAAGAAKVIAIEP